MQRSVEFYSEGTKLAADLYLPDNLSPKEQRPGVVLCHGYTGVKSLYLPDMAAHLNHAGFVAIAFDYKGWGDSDGPRSRLAPYGRVLDVQAAITFLGLQPEVIPDKIGILGVSYGGSTVTWVGAVDPRVSCIVSVVGVGNGIRWMTRVRRPDEWFDLLARSKSDRELRVKTGQSELADRSEILMADRRSQELAVEQRRDNPGAVNSIPWEFVDDTMGFNPEWIVDKVSPRPIMFITTDIDRTVLPEESEQLYALAREPKKLVILKNYSHYEVYVEPALGEFMGVSIEWFQSHMLAQ